MRCVGTQSLAAVSDLGDRWILDGDVEGRGVGWVEVHWVDGAEVRVEPALLASAGVVGKRLGDRVVCVADSVY